MAERGLAVDHVTVWRWVQRHGFILNQRLRRDLRHANRTCGWTKPMCVSPGTWMYVYRAVDEAMHLIRKGQTRWLVK